MNRSYKPLEVLYLEMNDYIFWRFSEIFFVALICHDIISDILTVLSFQNLYDGGSKKDD